MLHPFVKWPRLMPRFKALSNSLVSFIQCDVYKVLLEGLSASLGVLAPVRPRWEISKWSREHGGHC